MSQENSNQEQKNKMGYCKICERNTIFVETLNPRGFWVCTECPYRTDETPKEKYDRLPKMFRIW